jgi:hypothetical protein
VVVEESKKNIVNPNSKDRKNQFVDTHSRARAKIELLRRWGEEEEGGQRQDTCAVITKERRKALGYIECARNTGKFWSG